MLPLLDFKITFDKSKDYLRCITVLNLFTAIVLLRSELPILLVLAILLGLSFLFVSALRIQKPHATYHQLSHHLTYWLLSDSRGRQIKYEQVAIIFEGGFFILLSLRGGNPHTTILLFNDQLTSPQRRALKIITKLINIRT